MSKNRYMYSTGHAFADSYRVESVWDADNSEWLAQDCAQNYHNEHDGWESSWPIEITIWTEGGKVIGRFSVDREHEPTFSATRLDSPASASSD